LNDLDNQIYQENFDVLFPEIEKAVKATFTAAAPWYPVVDLATMLAELTALKAKSARNQAVRKNRQYLARRW
jgi:hypothetical protein